MNDQSKESGRQAVVKRYGKMKEMLNGQTPNVDNVTEILSQLHPEISVSELRQAVLDMSNGISQMYGFEAEQEKTTAEQALQSQTEEMTEEQQKGYLSQLFDLLKKSDEAEDSNVAKAAVNGADIAQMPVEELRALVAEQLSNSAAGLMGSVLEAEAGDCSILENIPLKTEEDALLLSATQYSAACDGEITFEYTKMPMLLGQCAAAQAKIIRYCEGIVAEELSPDEKADKILDYAIKILGFLLAVACLFAYSMGVAALSSGIFFGLDALLGTGIISLILECLLIVPIVCISLAAVSAAIFGIGFGLHKLATKVLAPRFPKFKAFYTKLALLLGLEDPFEEEAASEENGETYAAADDVEEADGVEEADDAEEDDSLFDAMPNPV